MTQTDIIHWFPMRVTYSREMLAKDYLDTIGIESFIPMQYEHVKGKHPRHRELKPAIRNLIFVHSSQKIITELKMTKKELQPLRYIMHPIYERHKIISLAQKTTPHQRHLFARPTGRASGRRTYSRA